MDDWPDHEYERGTRGVGGGRVGSKKHIDRAAGAAAARQPLSFARRCAILAIGGTALVVEVTAGLMERAQTEVVRQLGAWGETLERTRARFLGRSESER
jgi:hypothetical protein